MFLRIARDPFRYFRPDPDESAASPGNANHTTAFWSDQGQTLPGPLRYRQNALLARFQRRIRRPVGIIEDFPANRDQICLIIGQDSFGPIAADDEPDCHGHDIGVTPDITYFENGD
jgi:hypothetical protein